MSLLNRARRTWATATLFVMLALILDGCGGGAGGGAGGGDWYYHWSCNGDYECLTTNPTGQASGTLDEGPVQVNCTQLMQFAAHFWGSSATNSCDQSAAGGGTTSPTLQSLVVTPSSATRAAGQTVQLTATGHYSDGSTKDLTSVATWSVAGVHYIGAPQVVTVSATGLVTAVSPGTGQIQASYGGLSGTATISVSAPLLTGITVTPANPTLEVGAAQQFTAMATYSDASTVDVTNTASWYSTAPSVAAFHVGNLATVGLATGLAAGTTTISAQYGGQTGSTTLTVHAATLISITVLPASPTLAAGLTVQFSARGSYSNGSTADLTGQVTWTSGTPAVASITSGGLATALSPGTSQITATLVGISGSTTLTVGPVALESITVTPAAPTVTQGKTQQLTASGHYSDGSAQDLTSISTWTSATPSVANVSATGLVTAIAPGSSVVTATSGGKAGSTTVNVVAFGSVWQSSPSGTTSALNGVAWCKGQYVAVGAAGTIVTSPDGITWSAQSSGTSSDLYAVACSPNLIVAAGATGALATSPDGTHWTTRTQGGATGTIRAVVWAGTQFLVGGDWGYLVGSAAGLGDLAASVDGTAWAIRANAVTNTVQSIAWSGSRFVIAGYSEETSTDGVTWNVNSTQALYGAAWTGTTFALVGTSGFVYLTSDGTNFSVYLPAGTLAAQLNSVVWSGAQLTTVGNGGTIFTSPDGVTWTSRASGTTANLVAVASSGTSLVAVGSAGAVLLSN